uniref:Hydroxymethylglutaryl-CoA synthase n=1 Tax=Meloidogyne hapla TaxID=6305 RepID=A0A1I8B1J4_MELHA
MENSNVKENGLLLNGVHNLSVNSTSIVSIDLGKPQNVGIIGAEFYFPKSYVDQKELEKFDNVSSNKYTLGLGQYEMAFCHENEDSCSMALSVTAQLLENYNINPSTIGFLAVGTETLVDRSKSIKSVLMDLFLASGNTDIEGVDEKNACFGGTQALLHSADWIYSNYEFEGRLAIVVCVDVAVYARGPARSTGGAGAIAFLIGPDAPIVFDRGLRSFYSSNVYDFYKPIGGFCTEYPKVDGPNSVGAYLHALNASYNGYLNKWKRINNSNDGCSLDNFRAVLFHSPYSRLTQKAFAWISFVDYQRNISSSTDEKWEDLEEYKEMSLAEILQLENSKARSNKDRFTDKALIASASDAQQKLLPYLEFGQRIGNITPFSNSFDGERILLFSYGSGCVAAMFSLSFNFNAKTEVLYSTLKKSAQSAFDKLNKRIKFSPEQFTQILEKREEIVKNGECYLKEKEDSIPMFPGAFYLKEIDSSLRRFYERFDKS